MNSAINKRCANPTCGGNGNCAVCPKRMAEQFDSGAFEAVTEYAVSKKEGAAICLAVNIGRTDEISDAGNNSYAIAIDLGTTTLAFALVDNVSAQVLHTVTSLNSQRKYGADVLSRIQASVAGKKKELQECIQKDLCEGIDKLLEDSRVVTKNGKECPVEHIFISGNTTMVHLLMGYDCSTLGVYPFMPVNTEFILGTAKELLGYVRGNIGMAVTIFPCISAFIGGDIVSGLYALDFAQKEDINLFIDLGTNGEMALGNKDRILVTSVAAGPAFEGGNISCGTGSVAGAICALDIEYNPLNGNYDVNFKTLRDEPPCGICGTGVIEAVAELLKNRIIDETGLYRDDFFENGFMLSGKNEAKQMQDMGNKTEIVLSQKDIREFQMAKAAVRAGIDILISQYGIKTEAINRVYLAGGFGFNLNVVKAVSTGLLPEEISDKVRVVGNGSMGGMVKFLSDKEQIDKVQSILNITQEIILGNNEEFNAKYLRSMAFDV